uniref:Phosphatidylinositol-glycan biosynthesis class W protein n=1 Tax=Panagrolaimus sp. PS1159 TaxID=55785 RepID=A0AC35GZ12_9BILA
MENPMEKDGFMNDKPMGKHHLYSNSFEGQWEVLQVEFIGVLQILLRNLCLSIFFQRNYVKPTAYLTEFVTLTFPMLFCLTIFSEYLTNFVLCLVYLWGFLTVIQWYFDKPVYYIVRNTDYLTYFRTGMFIGTAIGIMAVDFNVWPERFVGILKEFLLYFLNYKHSLIEYGEHWNFFFTLAFLKLFTMIFPYPKSVKVGLALGLFYQMWLCYGLEKWILRFDRNSWNPIDANREGIFSLFGYIFEYSVTLVIARFIDEVDGIFNPSIQSGILCLVSGALCFLTQLLAMSIFGEPCRKIANIPYVFAMLSTKILQVGCFQFMHVRDSERSKKQESKMLNLIEGISSNCLWYFLIANLGVLFINLMINTRKIDNIGLQMFILIGYNFVTISIIYFWYLYKNKKSSSNSLPILKY